MHAAKELLSDAWRGLGWVGAASTLFFGYIAADFIATGNTAAGIVLIFMTVLFVVQCVLNGILQRLIDTQNRLIDAQELRIDMLKRGA